MTKCRINKKRVAKSARTMKKKTQERGQTGFKIQTENNKRPLILINHISHAGAACNIFTDIFYRFFLSFPPLSLYRALIIIRKLCLAIYLDYHLDCRHTHTLHKLILNIYSVQWLFASGEPLKLTPLRPYRKYECNLLSRIIS